MRQREYHPLCTNSICTVKGKHNVEIELSLACRKEKGNLYLDTCFASLSSFLERMEGILENLYIYICLKISRTGSQSDESARISSVTYKLDMYRKRKKKM